jgi:putative protein-disulfide isomerase
MNSTRLLYVTDPLCLWCYGISSVIEEFYQILPSKLLTETINGGLFPNKQAKICDEAFRDYLKNAAEHVTKLSGKTFSPLFWKLLSTPNFIYDTEPSAKASITVKKFTDEKTMLEFMHTIQKAFFVEGKNVMQPSVLASLAQPFGISEQAFLDFYISEKCLNLTKKDYSEAKQLGVQGFPALLYLNGRQGYKLSAGFSDLKSLKKALSWAENECSPTKTNNGNSCSDQGCKT